MPKEIKRKTIITGISVLPKHQEYVAQLMEEKAFMSVSDVYRRALEFLHEKTFPSYVYNKSASDILKRKKIKEVVEFENIPPEDYAKEHLNAEIITFTGDFFQGNPPWRTPGKKGFPANFTCAVLNRMGNGYWFIPLEDIKSLKETDEVAYNYHFSTLEEKSVQEAMISSGISFFNSYGKIKDEDVIRIFGQEFFNEKYNQPVNLPDPQPPTP
jgi:Arc/MetJ-type ribon-helix-helix transcriptional regulator